MAEWPGELAPRALGDLRRLPVEEAEGVLRDLQILRHTPWPGPPKVKRLRGQDPFRLRTGDYRWVFEVRGDRAVVLRVVDRKEFDRVLRTL